MKRLDLALFCALLLCAIAVVHTQHRARRLFVDLQRELGVGEQLATDLRRLEADQATLAAANRVERAASGLRMRLPEPSRSYALAAGVAPLAEAPAVLAPAHDATALAALGSLAARGKQP